METWLALVVVAVLVLIVWYVWRKDRGRERAEIEVPDDILEGSAVRSVSVSGGGRGSRSPDHDRHQSEPGDGGGGDSGGGGD